MKSESTALAFQTDTESEQSLEEAKQADEITSSNNVIALRPEPQLPATIEDLHDFILIAEAVLNAHKEKIQALENINSANAACEAAIQDGQRVGEVLIDAQVKLGELTTALPKKAGSRSDLGVQPDLTKKKRLEAMGIDNNKCSAAETLFNNPEIVEMEKNRAKQARDLPDTKNIVRTVREMKKLEAKKNSSDYDPTADEKREINSLSHKAHKLSESIKQKEDEVKNVIAEKGDPYDRFKACYDTLAKVLE